MTRFRLVRRAHRWVVQEQETYFPFPASSESKVRWRPVLLGHHRFRLLGKLHLLLLREFNRE